MNTNCVRCFNSNRDQKGVEIAFQIDCHGTSDDRILRLVILASSHGGTGHDLYIGQTTITVGELLQASLGARDSRSKEMKLALQNEKSKVLNRSLRKSKSALLLRCHVVRDQRDSDEGRPGLSTSTSTSRTYDIELSDRETSVQGAGSSVVGSAPVSGSDYENVRKKNRSLKSSEFTNADRRRTVGVAHGVEKLQRLNESMVRALDSNPSSPSTHEKESPSAEGMDNMWDTQSDKEIQRDLNRLHGLNASIAANIDSSSGSEGTVSCSKGDGDDIPASDGDDEESVIGSELLRLADLNYSIAGALGMNTAHVGADVSGQFSGTTLTEKALKERFGELKHNVHSSPSPSNISEISYPFSEIGREVLRLQELNDSIANRLESSCCPSEEGGGTDIEIVSSLAHLERLNQSMANALVSRSPSRRTVGDSWKSPFSSPSRKSYYSSPSAKSFTSPPGTSFTSPPRRKGTTVPRSLYRSPSKSSFKGAK